MVLPSLENQMPILREIHRIYAHISRVGTHISACLLYCKAIKRTFPPRHYDEILQIEQNERVTRTLIITDVVMHKMVSLMPNLHN